MQVIPPVPAALLASAVGQSVLVCVHFCYAPTAFLHPSDALGAFRKVDHGEFLIGSPDGGQVQDRPTPCGVGAVESSPSGTQDSVNRSGDWFGIPEYHPFPSANVVSSTLQPPAGCRTHTGDSRIRRAFCPPLTPVGDAHPSRRTAQRRRSKSGCRLVTAWQDVDLGEFPEAGLLK